MTKKMIMFSLTLLSLICCLQFSIADVQSNLYTVDQAMDMATKEFNAQLTTSVDKMKMSRQIDTLSNNVNTLMQMGILSFSDKIDKTDPLIDSIATLRNGQDSITDGEAVQREAIRDAVKTLYITIVKLETQEKMLSEQIALNEKLSLLDRKKVKTGLMGTVELEKNYNAYQKTIRQRDSLKIGINKLYASLKDLMGVPTSKTIFLDTAFITNTAIVPVSHINNPDLLEEKNLKVSMYIKSLQRNSDLFTSISNRYPADGDPAKDADLEVLKAKISLQNTRDALIYKYESAYQQVVDMYENAKQKEQDLKVKKLELEIAQKKLKTGASSNYELLGQTTLYKVAELDYSLSKIEYVLSIHTLQATLKGTN